MNPAPINEVVDLLRALRLPHMRAAAPDLLATAKAQRWEPAEAMSALLTEELAGLWVPEMVSWQVRRHICIR